MGKRWWEKKSLDGTLYLILAGLVATLMLAGGVYAAVQFEVGNYEWDSTNSKWARKVAGAGGATSVSGTITPSDNYANPTSGAVPTISLLSGWDGSTWDRILATGGALQTSASGAFTPSDTTSNPSTAIAVQSHNMVWSGTSWGRQTYVAPTDGGSCNLCQQTSANLLVFNGTNWDRARSVGIGDNAATGVLASGLYMYDGSNWDRVSSATLGSKAGILVHDGKLADVSTNITTNTSTIITAEILTKMIVNIAGTGSTAAFYNDNSGACDTNYLFTLPTTSTGQIFDINWLDEDASESVCVLTAGTAASDISILTQDF